MSSTCFTKPTFALAAQFPELDPVALLQLVEAPAVSLAFYEFRARFWDGCKKFGPVRTHIQIIEKAFDDFSKKPEGFGALGNIGGGNCSYPDEYTIHDPFYAFMSRVYAWATQDYLDLPIRHYLENTSLSASLLWGVLGICISVHEDGSFPKPLLPLPDEELEFHTDGELTVSDIENWRVNTMAMRYTPRYFPLWQEWRIRHEALKDLIQRNQFVSSWTAKVTEDYSSGPDNAVEEAYDWLQVMKVAKFYKDMQHRGQVQTKHCIFEIQITHMATDIFVPTAHEIE